ncbi:MAG: beta-lactamase family protein [Fimbriimonadaceae bacterium]|nr:beta-lactamase family protein [Fimbriimonadaceae bacterium]
MIALFALLASQTTTVQQVDGILTHAVRDSNLPSIAAAFVLDGKVVLKKTYGVKTLGKTDAPNDDTVYGIGSTSKAMTAFGLMILVDQGKLNLNDPVGNYLPKLPESWKPIKVINFLTHTSGLPDGRLQDAKGKDTWEQFSNWAASHPIKFKPGTDQQYSNLNFAVAGQLIEQVSKTKYLSFMQTEVWGPLRMSRTGSWVEKLNGNMASPYMGPSNRLAKVGVNVVPAGIPSGGLVSSLNDMLAWEEAMRERRLLNPGTYEEMFTPVIPPQSKAIWHFSPGWQVRRGNKMTVIAKNGSVQGYMSMIQMVPERGAAIILLWNVQNPKASMWKECATIWNQVLGIPLR